MALFRKFFYRKPPEGLLEISERVFVFDCCFTTDVLVDDEYKVYMGRIVDNLREYSPDASFMVFNFREGENQSQIASILSEYDMTVMDYPRHYESCPLLTMEMIHHFLRSSESWLSLGQRNLLLMHCERGGWPVLAFMLAALLIYRKQYIGEQKTLDMIYKQAPRELLQLMSPLNPLPSQLRYLQYVSRRNVGSEWPPLDRALTLDCVILRVIPNVDGEGGCRPIFRIYGQDPFMVADRTPKVLFSTPKRSKVVRHYKQIDCELVKIDINCHVQGDVVLECICLNNDLESEVMMFRVMFNTAFIRSNILMLNRDEIDVLWDAKDQFTKDFRIEVLFSEMDATSSLIPIDLPVTEENGLPVEAFAKVQEMFNNVDWLDPKISVLQQINNMQENLESCSPQTAKKIGLWQEPSPEEVIDKPKPEGLQQINNISEKLESGSPQSAKKSSLLQEPNLERVVEEPKLEESENNFTSSPSMVRGKQLMSPLKPSLDVNSPVKKINPQELQIVLQCHAQPKIISQRLPHTSLSTPASYCNSLQGSPVPVSRYHSAPSALGITALLHDHRESENKELAHLVTISPRPGPSDPVPHLSKHLQPRIVSILPPPQPSLSLQPSMEVPATSAETSLMPSPSPPPPPPPPPRRSLYASRLSSSLFSHHHSTSIQCKGQQSSVPLAPAQSTSLSGVSSLPSKSSVSVLPTPPPLPPFSGVAPFPTIRKSFHTPPPPPPPSNSSSGPPPFPLVKNSFSIPSPPPPPPPPPPPSPPPSVIASPATGPVSSAVVSAPPPPPLPSGPASKPSIMSSALPPPSPPSLAPKGPLPKNSPHVPPSPPPPAPFANGLSKTGGASRQSYSTGSNGNIPPIPGPPFSTKGRLTSRTSTRNQDQSKRTSLKPYHWLKLTRAMQGSLWAEAQKSDEASKAPEFDMSELESLFAATVPNSNSGSTGGKSNRRASGPKSDKVILVDLRRAYNCEIMLTKVKVPLPDLMNSVLALDDSALDVDQVDNLIKFCPTKEEIELLKFHDQNYSGEKENLGKCEQFFLELMKVPRVESKLRVFSFKIQFHTQVSDLSNNLNIVNSVSEEIRNSAKLKRIMQTILSLGNALNHGTARGSAVGFRLDSLLKLTDTRAKNNKMTLMHYLCKVLAEKLPELLDFPKDLKSLEASTKIQLKYLAEEMQAISKGLEKVVQELTASENDGPVSENFCKILKEFLGFAEAEVRSLASLYSGVGRNADALALYFGEDPARTPFEQVVSTLLNFVRLFVRAHEENCKQLELDKKKAQKEAENENMKSSTPKRESENYKAKT
ncbi:formin-like protein 18 isoform X1 [Actinidia eriantha]|uniref:formin-like protein 18 isoform X1 n=1 Tax=Actinidia eriantha TaxID=165200 RepID=UPI00258B0256|nr:formin-like protein 18 isoform X1 [Actinidia eriantha]